MSSSRNRLPVLLERPLSIDNIPTGDTRTPKPADRLLRKLQWRLFDGAYQSQVVSRTAFATGERYELANLVSPDLYADAPESHFLRYATYVPRAFLKATVRNVLVTRNAKAIGAPGRGLIDEFCVGGAAAIPADLFQQDAMAFEIEVGRREERLRKVSGVSVPLCHYGGATFGHLVLDALLQIFVFRNEISTGEARVLLDPGSSPLVSEALSACGVTARQQVEIAGPVLLLEEACLSSALAAHGVYFPFSMSVTFFEWLRDVFACRDVRPTKRIYVRRRGDERRGIQNSTDVEALVQDLGFEVIAPETQTLAEQVRTFSAAHTALSTWGSGLCLAPLLGGERRVFELLPTSVNDAWFHRQAAVHGLDYRPLLHPCDGEGRLKVDLEALARHLHRAT